MLPLVEVVPIAYDKFRDAPQKLDSKVLELLRRLDGSDQKKVPSHVCQMLFNDTTIPLYGVYPPSKTIREIPRKDAEAFMFSDDASELYNQYNPSERYHSLAVKKADFRQRLKEIT